jgi:hypothetical protein
MPSFARNPIGAHAPRAVLFKEKAAHFPRRPKFAPRSAAAGCSAGPRHFIALRAAGQTLIGQLSWPGIEIVVWPV